MPKIPEKKNRYRFWIVVGACIVASVSTAWAAKTVRGFLGSDARFVLRAPEPGVKNEGVTVSGATYTSLGSVQQVFAADYGRSIFNISIAERRRRLLAIDWIEDASVSRIWPNRIAVHVKERTPVAFVNVPRQAFLLIDAEGVLLSPPPRANFAFPVLSGVWVAQSEADRKVRVGAAMRLLDDLGPVAKDVSEVNAASPDDLRITTEINGRAVDLLLGDANFGARYRNFMEHFADIHAGSPNATVFDLRIDDRITANDGK
jgi:cell division protein FtsQ